MTYQRLAIFDENKIVQQVVLVDTRDMENWLLDNPSVTDNYVIVGEHDEVPFVGYFWDDKKKNWLPPKPYSNWVLDSNNSWIPPIPKPTEEPEGDWHWHQNENQWVDIVPQP